MRAGWGISMLALVAAFQAGVSGMALAQTVTGPVAPVAGVAQLVNVKLDEAAALVQTENWQQAVDVYKTLVNDSDDTTRGQARFGLAVALSQLGRDNEALKALEGTSADDTELGQAVGSLRGNLMLQLAEKSLMDKGTSGSYLNDYDRLLVKPNATRANRLKALETAAEGEREPLRVGVLLPLTGPLAPVGRDVLRGLQLALTTQPAWRGVGVELLPRDSTRDLQQAFDDTLHDGARIVVGPLLSKNVRDLAGRAQAVGIPLLALSSDGEAAQSGVFVVPPLPTDQARLVARWAVDNGKLKVGGLVPSTPYGNEVLEAFRQGLTDAGGTMARVSFFNPQNVDLGASVRQLAGGQAISGTVPFDAVFMPIPASTMPMAASQMAFYDFDRAGITMLGTALWQDPSLLSPSSRAVRGGVFAAPARPEVFISQFTEAYGQAPQGMAIQGYDLGRLLLQLAAEQDWSGQPLADLLTRPEGFYGSGGYLKFDANGHTERGMALTRVGNGQFEIFQPALQLAPLPVPANVRPSGKRGYGRWW